ncbi:MAG: hypothetical protein M3P26_12420 [Gemmatimonadota bacterium]|nr:hypothetical protein [Gemmatimonadota bacterium]
MPRKRHRNRLIPSIPAEERAAILAGLRGEKRRKGMDLFAYWSGQYPRRDSHRWERVKTVFQSLSLPERRAIIRGRRKGMTGRVWINRVTGRVRNYGDFPATRKWDPSDPRLVLFGDDDAA